MPSLFEEFTKKGDYGALEYLLSLIEALEDRVEELEEPEEP